MPRLDPQSLPQHLDRLYRAAWALCGSAHDAEDLVQETCVRVLARPRVLRGEDELGYLMQALRNTFLSQRRSVARRPQSAPGALEEYEPADARAGTRPAEATEAREIFAAIAELPEHHRLALVAVDVVGLSYLEAANILDTRDATIATRVFRARAQVARRFERGPRPQPVAPPSPAPAAAPAERSVSRTVQQHKLAGQPPSLRAEGKIVGPGGVLLSEVSHEQ